MDYTKKFSLELEKPTVFSSSVVAGVFLRNTDMFPPHGFSLLKASILTDREVQQHRDVAASVLRVQASQLQFQNQTHGTDITLVRTAGTPVDSDGMITQSDNVVLCVSIADCAAVLLHDPDNNAVAGLHSGWRGTVGNIVEKGIAAMEANFGSRPSSLRAYVSACASGNRYVVRDDVADLFSYEAKCPISDHEWLLDIRVQIEQQLLDGGVLTDSIEMSDSCTIGDDRYHSYRRDGKASGRMVAFIKLQPQSA